MLTVRAPAKVNLVLEVVGRGPEYHDLCSIAQTIDLCDTLTFEPAPDIIFTCSEPELMGSNLVRRAARLLQERCSISSGARIHLDKRIPWAAGLGGGSSDAAGTLLALNRMWGAGLSHEQLVALGAEIGSDVPLFLVGGTVLLEGRGERVRPLPDLAETPFVILTPHTPVTAGKTGLMYGRLRPEMFTRGQFVRAASFALERGGAIPEVLMFNVFEKVAGDVFDGLTDDRTLLERATGRRAHLAGSGPCLYALVDTEELAREATSQLQSLGRRAFAARAISADRTHSDFL
jgi:4-diphosphocytidyl-2-C-methyl-D-erythritol kinase